MVEEALGLGDVWRRRRKDGGEDVAILLDLLALVGDRRRAREGAIHGFVRPPGAGSRREGVEGYGRRRRRRRRRGELGFWGLRICGDGGDGRNSLLGFAEGVVGRWI